MAISTAAADAAPGAKTLKISQRNASLLNKLPDYRDLEVLSISCVENLRALPDSIGKLAKLRELIIDNGNGCTMNPQLPESLGDLHHLEKLVLFGAQDPSAGGSDHPVQPRERHRFPASMSQLKTLTYLDLGRNDLDAIPAFVGELPNLRELHFQYNEKLKTLPPFLANLHELRTLRLEADDLNDLPGFLNALPKLTSVALGNNCSITQSKTKMADLKKRFPKIVFDFEEEYDCPSPK
jgi:Leucine-rich repeat (LRR) protein